MLVFNEKNGQTSLLSHRSAFVLNCLSQNGQCDEVELKTSCAMNDGSDDAEFNSIIGALRASGLII